MDYIKTKSYNRLKNAGFKLCLVSPDRWDRAGDINKYIKMIKEDNIHLDAVMCSIEYADIWEKA